MINVVTVETTMDVHKHFFIEASVERVRERQLLLMGMRGQCAPKLSLPYHAAVDRSCKSAFVFRTITTSVRLLRDPGDSMA